MKKTLIIAPLALLASACASTQSAETPSDPAALIAAAEAATARAAAVGYEWRDTGKILKEAKEAAAAGDTAKAAKLAGKALRQSENAVKQHDEQMEAVKSF